MIQEIFRIPIWKKNLNLNLEKLYKDCYELKKEYESRSVSNRGGYQSTELKTDEKKLQELIELSEKEANLFADHLQIKNVELDNYWLNINQYKDFNIPHVHTFSLLSAVFYIKTPKDCGNISFTNPSRRVMEFDWSPWNVKNWNEYNSYTWWMPSEENMLYIFPSWLEHFVDPNQNQNEERISIALNYRIKQGEK